MATREIPQLGHGQTIVYFDEDTGAYVGRAEVDHLHGTAGQVTLQLNLIDPQITWATHYHEAAPFGAADASDHQLRRSRHNFVSAFLHRVSQHHEQELASRT